MSEQQLRVMRSEYMEFAKTQQSAKYNLAVSGMIGYPLADLPVSVGDLEINGSNNYGYVPLLEAIARKCGVEKQNVATTLGTSMANYLAMAALINPGDEIVMEDPIYELLTSAAGCLGARIRKFSRRAETGFLIDPSDVARAVSTKTKLIVITNLHNPGSAYTDETVLRQIGKLAEAVGAYVLVDEVYLDAMFDDAPKTAFHLGNNFIVTNSLTKIYGLSGIRCGWVLAEPGLIRKIWQLIDITYGSPAYPAELLSVVAFRNLPKIMERSRTILTANHRLLDQFLDTRNDLSLVRQRYGTVVFPGTRLDDVTPLAELLRYKYETSIVPGKYFGMPGHFRLGICGETAMVEGGLSRLGRALDEFTR